MNQLPDKTDEDYQETKQKIKELLKGFSIQNIESMLQVIKEQIKRESKFI